jgi:hypothetical protein
VFVDEIDPLCREPAVLERQHVMQWTRLPQASLWIVALTVVAVGAGCSPQAGSGTLSAPVVSSTTVGQPITAYTNPADPLLLTINTQAGEILEVYSDKDADGLATQVTGLRYQSPDQVGTGQYTRLLLSDDGNLRQIIGADGSTITFQWTGEFTAVLSAVSGDGSVQVTTPLDLGNAATGSPSRPPYVGSPGNLGTAPRNGTPLQLDVQDASTQAANPIRTAKTLLTAAAAPTMPAFVRVTRCGHPVDGAYVSVTAGNPYATLPPTFTATPTGSPGEYMAQIPTVARSDAGPTAEQYCRSIEKALGIACKAAKVVNGAGSQTAMCVAISAAIEATPLGVVGAGVPVFAACEAGVLALSVFQGYCSMLGASGGGGDPSVASVAICNNISAFVDRFVEEPPSIAVQAFANVTGFPPARSDAHDAPAGGPFPVMAIAIGTNDPVINPISVAPADPAPGQPYVATVKVECIAPDTLVTLSVTGSDGYTDHSSAVVDGNSVLTLTVPGAWKGIADLVAVKLNGITKLQVAVVF